jgi:hypothetical protein
VQLSATPAGKIDTGLSPLATPSRLSSLSKTWKGRVILGGPSSSLEQDVPRAEVISGSEFAAAFGRLVDLLDDDKIRHGNQPELNEAVRLARSKPFGALGEKSLQLKDAPGVGPLAAVVRAVHGLVLAPKKPPARPATERSVAARRPPDGDDLSVMGF